MHQTIRWGILGTGNIACAFAEALGHATGAELVAVGSRTRAKADEFGDRFDVQRRHGSYADLADDEGVEAVYVSTPHPFHKANSMLCLQAGKAVLCEKPFTINAREAQEMISLARREKRFLMEAMWVRFLPGSIKTRQLLADGAIGEPRLLMADLGIVCERDPDNRFLNPDLGGGALLDVGVYPLSLAMMLFGTPTQIVSQAHIGETGVDEQAGVILGFPRGRLAVLATTLQAHTPREATICGTEGQIRLHATWGWGHKITLSRPDRDSEEIDVSFEGPGYVGEIEEVGRCLRQGRLESDVMPLDESLAIMQTMDAIRAQWSLKYPME